MQGDTINLNRAKVRNIMNFDLFSVFKTISFSYHVLFGCKWSTFLQSLDRKEKRMAKIWLCLKCDYTFFS